mgnify:CR=1 FL=1
MVEIDITQIAGITIGQAENVTGGTGCTVILCEEGATAGVDVRGGAPASRETELLKPLNTVEVVHAVVLSGGSAYGLDAAAGVMAYLEEKGVGFDMQVAVVPIVCGASLFDLQIGDAKCRPDKAMGYAACCNAGEPLRQGNVGAGTGATVGKLFGPERMMKSGLGAYAIQVGDLQVGAIVAVNAMGDVRDVTTGALLAGLLNAEKTAVTSTVEALCQQYARPEELLGGNTTLGCIITNARLNKCQMNKVASIAHNGFAKAIEPVHTSADGDTIFALATGKVPAQPDAVGVLAAETMARAINQAVLHANSAYGLLAAKDLQSC